MCIYKHTYLPILSINLSMNDDSWFEVLFPPVSSPGNVDTGVEETRETRETKKTVCIVAATAVFCRGFYRHCFPL